MEEESAANERMEVFESSGLSQEAASSSAVAAGTAAAESESDDNDSVDEEDDLSESGSEDESRSSNGSNGIGVDWFYLSGEDDTGDEDVENTIFTGSFREAADHLDEAYGGPIVCLCVNPPHESDEEEDENELEIRDGNDAASFRRFVTALGRREGRGGRAVGEVHFSNDVEWDAVWEEDLARFFGNVLPNHPTLEIICLAGHGIPQLYVRLFVSAIQAGSGTPLRNLELRCAIDHDSVQTIADMIRRNVPLSELQVDPLRGPELDAGDCKLLCQSVIHNTNLRVLQLHAKEALADTLDDVVAKSSLRRLVVSAHNWPEECVASVARQLRTNTTLESLHVINSNDDPSPFFLPIAQVLETYNVTLRKVTVRWGFPPPIRAEIALEERVLNRLRRRNRRIRGAIEQLKPRSYHLSPTSLWPRALGMLSPLPTLLYRFLRQGDLNTVCDLLQPDASARGKKRRHTSTTTVDF